MKFNAIKALEESYKIEQEVRELVKDYDTSEFDQVYDYMRTEFGLLVAGRLENVVVSNASKFKVELNNANKYMFVGETLEKKRRAYIFMTILKSGKLEDMDLLTRFRRVSEKTAKKICEVSIVHRP